MFTWEYVKQATSSDAIKQKYEAELKRKLKAEELVKVLEKDVEDNNQNCVGKSRHSGKMHSKIGRPASESVLDSAVHRPDHRRRATGETSRFQGEDREFEETASNGHYIQSKIKNKESLLSLDRKDDLLDDQADDDDDYNAIKTLKVTPRRPLQMI